MESIQLMDCVIHNANYCITDNGNSNSITEINVVDEVYYTARNNFYKHMRLFHIPLTWCNRLKHEFASCKFVGAFKKVMKCIILNNVL